MEKLLLADKPLYVFSEADSALNKAWSLFDEGQFEELSSVFVESQNAGRGRMGRVWLSPAGNVYAAFRLPFVEPWTLPAGSVCLAYLLCQFLAELGFDLNIKWPNDLVSKRGKVGGILLEQKKGAVIAGIGLNLGLKPIVPDRSLEALPPAALNFSDEPKKLWFALAEKMIIYYNSKDTQMGVSSLIKKANEILLWRGQIVKIVEPVTEPKLTESSIIHALVLGLEESGALRLSLDENFYSLWSGSIYHSL